MYRKILVGGVTAAAIVGAGTAALATTGSDVTAGTPVAAAATSSAPTPGGTSGKHKGHDGKGHGAKGLLRRAAHGSAVVKTKKGYQTVDFVKGTVTAVSAGSISVQAGDKTTETYTVGKDTKVRARTAGAKGKATTSSIAKVVKGDRVAVIGTGTSTKTATRVLDLGKK